MSGSVIHRDRRPRWITPSEIHNALYLVSLIYLLLILTIILFTKGDNANCGSLQGRTVTQIR